MGIENLPGSPMYNFIKRALAFTWPLFIMSIKPEVKISGLMDLGLGNFDCRLSWPKEAKLRQHINSPSNMRVLLITMSRLFILNLDKKGNAFSELIQLLSHSLHSTTKPAAKFIGSVE